MIDFLLSDIFLYLGLSILVTGLVILWIKDQMIIGLVIAVAGLILTIVGTILAGFINSENLEQSYLLAKPSLDIKSCPELEKMIVFSTNQTMVDHSKRNYNERCL